MTMQFNPVSGQFDLVGSGGAAGAGTVVIDGNTAGVTASISTGTMTLAGGNNITLSQNGNAVTISGASQNTYLQAVNITGNTSGATANISSGTAVLAGGNNITLSQNGQSITISAASIAPVLSYWDNQAGSTTAQAMTGNDFYIHRLDGHEVVFPGQMTVSTARLMLQAATSQTTNSSAASITMMMGLYTITGGTLTLINSASVSFGWTANTSSPQLWSGTRWITIDSTNWSSTPAFTNQQYYVGIGYRSAGAAINFSLVETPNITLASGSIHGFMGATFATNNTVGYDPFAGATTALRTVTTLPTSITAGQMIRGTSVVGPQGLRAPLIVFNNITNSY